MRAIGRGCLEFVLVWVVIGYGMYLYFDGRFAVPGPMYGAVIGSFFVAGAWGLFRNGLQARGQAALIRRSLRGDWPSDGSPYAAVGPAIPLTEPLVTPFKKQPCVLYSYELSRIERVRVRHGGKSRTETQRTVYMSGLAMAPWAVRSRSTEMRIIGFPIPDQFPELKYQAIDFGSDLRAFNGQTEFTDVGRWEVGKLIGHARSVFAEGEGQIRQDMRFSEAELIFSTPGGLDGCTLIEQFIPVDQPVCVIGRYDMGKGGLVNDLSHGGLQAIPGDGEEGARALNSRWQGYSFLAVIMAILGILGSLGLLTLRERSEGMQQSREQGSNAELLVAFQNEDLPAITAALENGASPDSLEIQDRPLMSAVKSQELFDLFVRHGASLEVLDRQGRPLLLAAIDSGNLLYLPGAEAVRVTSDGNRETVGCGWT